MRITELNASNCKTYLLDSDGEAALVDPVRERVESYRRDLEAHGLKLVMIVDTHTHADHKMLNPALAEWLGAPILMHRDSPIPTVHRHVVDGDHLEIGRERIEVMHTPGHTPDSISLRVPGGVFTGDTLLIGGSGRTDFPGGDAGAQYDAVTQRLFTLPDEIRVWPAHDYKGRESSTIGEQRSTNARFVGKTREQYIEQMANLGLAFSEQMQEALQVNQSGFESSEVAFPRIEELNATLQATPRDVARQLAGPSAPIILDVREPEEFVGDLGHIAGALLIPLDALEHRLPKLAGYHDHDVVVVCRAGARSATAAAMLRRAGFARVLNLRGGMLAWGEQGLPVQR